VLFQRLVQAVNPVLTFVCSGVEGANPKDNTPVSDNANFAKFHLIKAIRSLSIQTLHYLFQCQDRRDTRICARRLLSQ